jgi:hypothetical protein
MPGRQWVPVAAIALAVVFATGCGTGGMPVASPGPSPGLSIANGTTLTVTLLVNGTVVGTFAPGVERDPIPPTDLPVLPWQVEARSPSGRLLASVTVHPGDVSDTSGDGVRVDLSCGRLDIWSGPPMSGPAPGTGSPGDCAP